MWESSACADPPQQPVQIVEWMQNRGWAKLPPRATGAGVAITDEKASWLI
jgi:hypothetical protein